MAAGTMQRRPCPQVRPARSEAIVRYVEAAGVRLSSVGLGAWQFGSGEWGYGQTYVSDVAPAIVHRSRDLFIV